MKIKTSLKKAMILLCAVFMFISVFSAVPAVQAQASTKSLASYVKNHGKKSGSKYTVTEKNASGTVKLIYDSSKKTFTMKGTITSNGMTEKIELSGITGKASKKVTTKLIMDMSGQNLIVQAKVQGSRFTGKGTKGISGLKWNLDSAIPSSQQKVLKQQMVTLTNADLVIVYGSFMSKNGFKLSDIGFTKVSIGTLIDMIS